MNLFYTPSHAGVGRLSAFSQQEELNLIYRKEWNGFFAQERTEGLFCARAEDGMNFAEEALSVDAASGCVLVREDGLHLYFIAGDGVMHAHSASGERRFGPPALALRLDDPAVEPGSWQDPWVWRGQDGALHMIVAAKAAGGAGRRGCLAWLICEDGHSWRRDGECWTPGSLASAPVCPAFWQTQAYEYLFFTSEADEQGVQYRYRPKGEAAWRIAAEPMLDTAAFQYGRPVRWRGRDYLCGVVAARGRDPQRFRPNAYPGHDFSPWELSGTAVLYEMSAREDGTLKLRIPDFVKAAFPVKNELRLHPINGQWQGGGDAWRACVPHGYGQLLSDNEAPAQGYLEAVLRCEGGLQRAALAVQVDEDFTEGYYYYWEPGMRRIQLRTAYRMTEQGSWRFPHEVEMERFLPAGEAVGLQLVISDGLMLLCIDEQTMFSARLTDQRFKQIGLAAEHGRCAFSQLALFTPGANAKEGV